MISDFDKVHTKVAVMMWFHFALRYNYAHFMRQLYYLCVFMIKDMDFPQTSA